MTSEKLYSILQTVRPTKLHVLCQTESSTPVGCLPRINYKPSTRCRQVILRIFPKSQIPFNLSLNGEQKVEREQGITIVSSEVETHASRAVSRRLDFASPVPSIKNFREANCSLDLSGFGTLEDESDKLNDSAVCSENVIDRCWFQIQSSLSGFLDTFKFE